MRVKKLENEQPDGIPKVKKMLSMTKSSRVFGRC